MHALVGADRHRARADRRSAASSPGGQRLLDERDPGRDAGGHDGRAMSLGVQPSLASTISVRVGRAARTAAMRIGIAASPPSFTLSIGRSRRARPPRAMLSGVSRLMV